MHYLAVLIENIPLVIAAAIGVLYWKDRKETNSAHWRHHFEYARRVDEEAALYDVSFEIVPLDGDRCDWGWIWQFGDDWVWYFDGKNSEEHFGMRFPTELRAKVHFLRVMNPRWDNWALEQAICVGDDDEDAPRPNAKPSA